MELRTCGKVCSIFSTRCPEILPASNFWQLQALPSPSAIQMTSSCTLVQVQCILGYPNPQLQFKFEAENFCNLVEIRFSWRKLSQIAH